MKIFDINLNSLNSIFPCHRKTVATKVHAFSLVTYDVWTVNSEWLVAVILWAKQFVMFFLKRRTRTKRITNCYFLNVALCTRFVQCERWQGSLYKPHALLSMTHTCIQVPFCWVWLKTCYCKPFSKCYEKLEAWRPRGSVVCSTAVLCVVTQRSSLHDDPKNRAGSSARAWKLSSRLFSRPGWLPLVLRGWKICYKIDLYLPNSLQSRKLFNSFKTCGWTFSLKFVELIIVLINVVILLNLWPEVKALGMSSSAACFLVDKICWPWSLALAAFFIFRQVKDRLL